MSDTSTQYDDGDDSDLDAVQTEGFRNEIKAARQAKRENAELKTQLEAEKRERVFTEAGIPNEGTGALLRRAYDGPLDATAIKAEAAQYGLGAPAPAPATDPAVEAELAALRQAQGAVRGSGQDPEPEALQAYYDRLAQARKEYRPGSNGAVQRGMVIDAIEGAQKAGIDIHLVDGAKG